MTKTEALHQIAEFEVALAAIDVQQQMVGSRFTAEEIRAVRKPLRILKLIIQAGGFDAAFTGEQKS